MALINCSECGKNVSTNAKACPNCGVPIISDEVASPKHVGKNWEPCPRCGSNKVESRGVLFWFVLGFCLTGVSIWLLIIPPVGIGGILLGMFLMLIAPFAYKTLHCKDCNFSWRYASKKHKNEKCGALIEISKKNSQISTRMVCLIILLVVGGIIAAYVSSDQDSGSRPASPGPAPKSKPKVAVHLPQTSAEPEWDIATHFGMITTVWISEKALRDKFQVAQILHAVDRKYPKGAVWFFDTAQHAPRGVPMTDEQMLHWVGLYDPPQSETFSYVEVTDRNTSPPKIKTIKTTIRPGYPE